MPHFNATQREAGAIHQHKDEKLREYARQAEKLAQYSKGQEDNTGSTQAVEAKFITPHDPVIVTVNGGRLPVVPIEEALKLNQLKDELEDREPQSPPHGAVREGADGALHGAHPPSIRDIERGKESDASLSEAVPSSRTNPLFPPLPMYGPPSPLRILQCWFFRVTSSIGSLCFLLAIVAGAAVTSGPKIWRHTRRLVAGEDPGKDRPFYKEEKKRSKARKAAERAWTQQEKGKGTQTPSGESASKTEQKFRPTEGGPDPLVCDVAYYARRVGLDAESFQVQTEDGFLIELLHVYDPDEYQPTSADNKKEKDPDVFREKSIDSGYAGTQSSLPKGKKKYPVLLIHGLLQSAGAYCSNDDDSLAFFLAKSGYDVWLGNNRCGFKPRHTMLHYEDPRMWAWNIRQMGVMDLPALISRVLGETCFPKLALIAHSQGTTQTLVALAKEQRPEIGEKISVFCALAPAAYAGPLIGKMYFKFMRVVSPALFRIIFGIHSFIPLMMEAHRTMPGGLYAWMGYQVFGFLFNWSDARWERDLRPRMFQFAPVYVSSESMRWWLGRECFARQKCILATKEEGQLEDEEDEEDDDVIKRYYVDREPHITERRKLQRSLTSFHGQAFTHQHHDKSRGKFAWYDSRFPPLALWVCGADDLVDGRRLLRRFDRGREPHVRIVHKKIIEGYEHLDVIWAMDAIEKVGKEVREVVWRTVDPELQELCRVPVGCEKSLQEQEDIEDVTHQPASEPPASARKASATTAGAQQNGKLRSGGRLRMSNISEAPKVKDGQDELKSPTLIDSTKGEWAQELRDDHEEFNDEDDGLEDEKAAVENKEKEVEEARDGRGSKLERRESEVKFTDLEEKTNPLG